MSESQDLLQRFLFEGCDIRGEVVSLADSFAEVLANNFPDTGGPAPAPAPVQALLGEFLAAVALLSSSLKFQGVITLQAQGDGPVPLIMAECNHHRGLRAIVRPPESGAFAPAEGAAGLQALVGQGLLAITLDPDRGERYQGVVPMDAPHLAQCLEHYFAQSAQLPTRLWLAADGSRAGGLLVQALPQQVAAPEHNAERWDTVVTLADTIKSDELLYLDHQEKLYRLFNELEVRLFEPAGLRFACTCSEQRSLHALAQLPRDEIEQLLQEQGKITIDCQFCNQRYQFDAARIRAGLGEGEPTLH